MRYKEQVLLVQEEKRRVLESLERTALAWDARAPLGDTTEKQGLAAYAARQAGMHRRLKAKFMSLWSNTASGPATGQDEGSPDDDDEHPLVSDDEDGFDDLGSDEESDEEL